MYVFACDVQMILLTKVTDLKENAKIKYHVKWFQSGEEDLKNMGVRNWRHKSQD
jgi:hypothetical protein